MPDYQVLCTPAVKSLSDLSSDGKGDGHHAYRLIKIRSSILSELKFSRIQKEGHSCYFVSFILDDLHGDYQSALEYFQSIKFSPSNDLTTPPTITVLLDLYSYNDIKKLLDYLLSHAPIQNRLIEIQGFISAHTRENILLHKIIDLESNLSKKISDGETIDPRIQQDYFNMLWQVAFDEVTSVNDYLHSPIILGKSIKYHYPICRHVISRLEAIISDLLHFSKFQDLIDQLLTQVESIEEETLIYMMEIKAQALLTLLANESNPQTAKIYRQDMLVALSYIQFSKNSSCEASRYNLFKNTLSLLMGEENFEKNYHFFSKIPPEPVDNREIFAQYLIHIAEKVAELNTKDFNDSKASEVNKKDTNNLSTNVFLKQIIDFFYAIRSFFKNLLPFLFEKDKIIVLEKAPLHYKDFSENHEPHDCSAEETEMRHAKVLMHSSLRSFNDVSVVSNHYQKMGYKPKQ